MQCRCVVVLWVFYGDDVGVVVVGRWWFFWWFSGGGCYFVIKALSLICIVNNKTQKHKE